MLEYDALSLKIAPNDLKLATVALQQDMATNAIFSVQQCVEKTLKAYLWHQQQTHNKTHDLTKLIKECAKYDPTFNEYTDFGIDLKPFATKGRYADDYFEPDKEYVENSLKTAEKLLRYVNTIIEKVKPD